MYIKCEKNNKPGWVPTIKRTAPIDLQNPLVLARHKIHDLMSDGKARYHEEIAEILDLDIKIIKKVIAQYPVLWRNATSKELKEKAENDRESGGQIK